jgi:hypothetical protein
MCDGPDRSNASPYVAAAAATALGTDFVLMGGVVQTALDYDYTLPQAVSGAGFVGAVALLMILVLFRSIVAPVSDGGPTPPKSA